MTVLQNQHVESVVEAADKRRLSLVNLRFYPFRAQDLMLMSPYFLYFLVLYFSPYVQHQNLISAFFVCEILNFISCDYPLMGITMDQGDDAV